MIRILAASAALVLSAGAASAADARLTASLAQPVAAKTRVVAGGAVWTCEGGTCNAGAATSRSAGFRACQALAKEVGAVTAYGGRSTLGAEQLAKCNASAKASGATQTVAASAEAAGAN